MPSLNRRTTVAGIRKPGVNVRGWRQIDVQQLIVWNRKDISTSEANAALSVLVSTSLPAETRK
jgi:hypothetical protein